MKKVQVNFEKMKAQERGRHQFRTGYANRNSLLQMRAQMLTGKDKVLMKMYLEDGKMFGEMARLAGVSEGTIARRVGRLTRRLLRGEYMMCLRDGEGLSSFERAVAKDYFLEGLSQRDIVRKREVTVYQVRKALKRLQALVNSEVRRKDDDEDV